MTYLLVDDENIILMGMQNALQKVIGTDGDIYTTQNPYEAIEIAKNHPIDIAFLDVDMPGMNGLKLSEELQKICPDMNFVFATGYAHYSLDAWRTSAKDFILKPVGENEIKRVLDKLTKSKVLAQHALNKSGNAAKASMASSDAPMLKAMCFGNFELSVAGKPVHFTRKKSKEMMAYLIDRRGAMISTDEIRTILWEEDADTEEKKGYVRVLANDIKKSLELVGIDNCLINGQDCYSVDKNKVECDYWDFLEQKEEAIKLFQDEYMVQYSWGESTLARLLNMV